jgi:NADH-quinone oxidoreductase subunit H
MNVINDPFTWLANLIAGWLSGFLPPVGVDVAMMVLRASALGVFALVMFMVMTWIERKGVARIQDRIGPNLAGPFGLLQPLADGVKALTKEDITPAGADRAVYNAAPILSAAAAMLVFAVIPFGPGLIGADMNIGIFYVLAVSGLGVIAILMAGWSSNNKYALLGAFRVVANGQLRNTRAFDCGGRDAGWLHVHDHYSKSGVDVFVCPSALIVLFFRHGEVGRSPFDPLDAESEIIAGHHIEYSGMKFALFFWAVRPSFAYLASTALFGG